MSRRATTSTPLEAAYWRCDRIARASNFYRGLKLLPARKRRALVAVYAFMRHCDDISDNEGSVAEKRAQFARWRALFQAAMRGSLEDHSTLPALRDTIAAFHIPVEYFYTLIDGTEMDLTTTRYQSFDDLYRYCYHVASVVGLVCIHIFGFRGDRAKDCAQACGIAFQLTNILRDIREDLQRGRVYLPLEDLQRFNYTEDDLRREVVDARFRALMAFEADRARAYYAQARPLAGLIERDSRPAFWAMFKSYETILRRIEQRGYDVLCQRIDLTPRDGLLIALKALLKW